MLSNQTIIWLKQNDYDQNDINKVGKYGNTALMKAVREANTEVTKEILSLNPDLKIKNIDGNTALWNACFGQNFECIKMLVDAGIPLDDVNDNGVTALMYASSAGKTDIVKLLLKFKADKNIQNLDGFKAIDLAVNASIYKMLK